MKLKIKVTNEMLERAKHCGAGYKPVNQNCAIALAVRDIFPNAVVCTTMILPLGGTSTKHDSETVIPNSMETTQFIAMFDGTPWSERSYLPEYEFTITVPDVVIDHINIDDLQKCETMELVSD